jgi:hypothetical protein
MAPLLVIVSPTAPTLYTYLKDAFGSQTGDVILDRRVVERRQRPARPAVERRLGDRRQRDITYGLQTFGWALVRREMASMRPLS